jgi:hypothetical protein
MNELEQIDEIKELLRAGDDKLADEKAQLYVNESQERLEALNRFIGFVVYKLVKRKGYNMKSSMGIIDIRGPWELVRAIEE